MQEATSKSKELTVIKGHMVDVISSLQLTHQLDEIMPLLNLLKTLENYINSLNTGEWRNWNPAVDINEKTMKLGPDTIRISEKISFLLNRIHIESAYLASINKSVAFGIKRFYRRKDINQFVQQQTYSQEKKRLFIVALRLLLRDHESVNTTGLNLEFLTMMLLENIDSGIGSLMRLINKNCQVCAGAPPVRTAPVHTVAQATEPIPRFCFCQVTLDQSPDSRRHTGQLRFSLHGFMGIYEAHYLDRLLKENVPRLIVDQFNGDGASKPRRRCVLIVRDRFVHSAWSSSSLALSGEIAVHKAKEVEIQVWQAACKQFGAHDRIVAVAIVQLDSLVGPNVAGKPITVSLEPQGFVMCEMWMDGIDTCTKPGPLDTLVGDSRQQTQPPPPQPVYKKIGIKRRENIFTKLGGHRLARHVEANVPVSLWTDWFRDHIDRLAIPIERERQNTVERIDNERKALGVSKLYKVTPIKSVPTSTPITNRSGRKQQRLFPESYQKLGDAPSSTRRDHVRITPKINQTNPRAVCKFIRFDQFENAKSPVDYSNGNSSRHIRRESTRTSIERSRSRAAALLVSPVSKKPVTKSAEPKKTPFNWSTTEPINDQHHKFLKIGEKIKSSLQLPRNPSVVRSNIELAETDTIQFERVPVATPNRMSSFGNASRVREDSIWCQSEGGESDGETGWREANMFSKSVLQSPFSLDRCFDLLPTSVCSPRLPEFGDEHDPDDEFENKDQIKNNKNSFIVRFSDDINHRHENGSRHSSVGGRDRSDSWSSQDRQDEPNELQGNGTDREQDKHVHNEIAQTLSPQIDYRPMDINDLDLICVLGLGHFGKVLLARHKARNKLCAIKTIQKTRASVEPEYDSLLAEKSILMTITKSQHPFLVGLIGCFQTDRYLVFAMEYASGGDLMGHIHKAPFSEIDAKFYIACVVLALEFLHDKNIVFRDLKLDNVLMDRHGFAKVTDFGLSKENMPWDEKTSTFCGTPEFLAPEIISMENYTRVVDWWALGVLLYEMIVGESPFPGDEDDEIYKRIIGSVPEPRNLSPDALLLVMRLLQQKPEKRLGYGEHGAQRVKEHQFFNDIDWHLLLRKQLRPPFIPILDSAIDTQYFEAEFTDKPITIEHDQIVEDVTIDESFFRDFDTCQQWPDDDDEEDDDDDGDYDNDHVGDPGTDSF